LLSRGLLDNLLDKDGNNAWQMREIAQELDAIEQTGGGRTIGRMGVLAGRKKRKSSAPTLETRASKFRVFSF
jgi:hypothetical protein